MSQTPLIQATILHFLVFLFFVSLQPSDFINSGQKEKCFC